MRTAIRIACFMLRESAWFLPAMLKAPPWVICVLENCRIRFVGASAVESQGWAKGRIADQQAFAESVTAALRDADAFASGALQAVVVGMGGPTVRGANGRGVLELSYVQEVQQTDVRRVME